MNRHELCAQILNQSKTKSHQGKIKIPKFFLMPKCKWLFPSSFANCNNILLYLELVPLPENRYLGQTSHSSAISSILWWSMHSRLHFQSFTRWPLLPSTRKLPCLTSVTSIKPRGRLYCLFTPLCFITLILPSSRPCLGWRLALSLNYIFTSGSL